MRFKRVAWVVLILLSSRHSVNFLKNEDLFKIPPPVRPHFLWKCCPHPLLPVRTIQILKYRNFSVESFHWQQLLFQVGKKFQDFSPQNFPPGNDESVYIFFFLNTSDPIQQFWILFLCRCCLSSQLSWCSLKGEYHKQNYSFIGTLGHMVRK